VGLRRVRSGDVRRLRGAGDIQRALRIAGEPGDDVLSAASENLVEDDLGIDHQGAAAIVSPDAKTNMAGAVDPIRDIHRLPASGDELPGCGFWLVDGDAAGAQKQAAVGIDTLAADAGERQPDGTRGAARGDREVVFQPLLVRAKDDIDAGIGSAQANAAEQVVGGADIGADQVIRPSRHAIKGLQGCRGIRAGEGHGYRGAVDFQNRRARVDGERVTRATSQVFRAARFKRLHARARNAEIRTETGNDEQRADQAAQTVSPGPDAGASPILAPDVRGARL